ncbi:MAG TPA: methyltransferase domain-containing protein [Stellaceae bacterium]|nr:methyltransferase domain-containing protein [Stellaceae bacterium]
MPQGQQEDLSQSERLVALLEHLGLSAACFGSAMPGDLAGLAAAHAERVAGLVFCVPSRLDPAPFAGLAPRLLMIAAEEGPSAETTARALRRLPEARRVVLAGYEAAGSWADAVADRTDEIAHSMIDFLAAIGGAAAPRLAAGEGSHAGVTYRILGRGPALVLMPFFLAPSQWDPALPQLSEHFTLVILGGPHLGGVASLEDRARMPTYQALFRTLIDLMAPAPGEAILEVGCGAGSLVRRLARRLGAQNPITAADANPYLLREAAALAAAQGQDGLIRFTPGNAESLPFADASFDCVYSVTVLEECNAERAIAEIVRVTRPGGRVGIIVRALDMRQWWNLDLPEPLRCKVERPPYSVARNGVADKSLYRRMRRAGLQDLVAFPSLVTLDRPGRPIWRNREDAVLSVLEPEEVPLWRRRRDEAAAEDLLFMAHPLHCAVGTKPRR